MVCDRPKFDSMNVLTTFSARFSFEFDPDTRQQLGDYEIDSFRNEFADSDDGTCFDNKFVHELSLTQFTLSGQNPGRDLLDLKMWKSSKSSIGTSKRTEEKKDQHTAPQEILQETIHSVAEDVKWTERFENRLLTEKQRALLQEMLDLSRTYALRSLSNPNKLFQEKMYELFYLRKGSPTTYQLDPAALHFDQPAEWEFEHSAVQETCEKVKADHCRVQNRQVQEFRIHCTTDGSHNGHCTIAESTY